jgi:uncharacterized phage protein gp47/JayE
VTFTAGTLDNTTHPVLAILSVADPVRGTLRAKFPKVKPAGGGDASDAAWQARMQTEIVNAHNATMTGGAANATPNLATLV